MRRIIVPARPGAFSALGLLCTDVLHDYIRSELGALDRLDPAHAEAHVSRTSRPRRRASLPRKASTRARRCSSAISTCVMPGRATSCACRWADLWQHTLDGNALAAARLALSTRCMRKSTATPPRRRPSKSSAIGCGFASPCRNTRRSRCRPARRRRRRSPQSKARGGCCSTPTRRSRPRSTIATSLPSARPSAGPAIVEQFDATTVVPPGWHAAVDRYGNLILERGDR